MVNVLNHENAKIVVQIAKMEKDLNMPDGSAVKRAVSIFLHFCDSTALVIQDVVAASIVQLYYTIAIVDSAIGSSLIDDSRALFY